MARKRSKIALLGATSHIAANLIRRWAEKEDIELTLFSRRPLPPDFDISAAADIRQAVGYDGSQAAESYDLIVNCVGAGTPNAAGFDPRKWFSVLEEFDRRAMNMLYKNPEALLINFSSGAIYGRNSLFPASAESVNALCVNNIPVSEYYGVVRLFLESRHRAESSLNIVDLRIFSYFSRYADPDSGYLATDILRSLLTGKTLTVNALDVKRDYIAPDELFNLIESCRTAETTSLNCASDVCSTASVGKFELLEYCRERFSLDYRIDDANIKSSPNGECLNYTSEYRNAAIDALYRPVKSSLQAVSEELAYALEYRGKCSAGEASCR
jgi:nucleoside-diphosphate-sugar epimerase